MRQRSNLTSLFILALILLIGAFLRFYNLNWDRGFYLHPDERMITMTALKIKLPEPLSLKSIFSSNSTLNPRFFAYGNLPLYFLKLTTQLAAWLTGINYDTYSFAYRIGRPLIVIFDLATVFLIYLLGKKIFSTSIGLVSGFLYATCVLPIQLSHAYTVDPLLNTCLLLTLYNLWLLHQSPRFQKAILVGLSFGLTLTIKISGVILIVPLLACLLAEVWFGFQKEKNEITGTPGKKILFTIFKKERLKRIRAVFWHQFQLTIVIGFIALGVFIICQPYVFLDWKEFIHQLRLQGEMTKNAYTFPYTLQYVNTQAYLYPLRNMVFWGMGPALGTASVGGILSLFFGLKLNPCHKKGPDKKNGQVILLIFFITYFLIVGRFAVKFMRYFLPLYPIFILFAGNLIVKILAKKRPFYLTVVAVFLCVHLFWVGAFFNIYRQPQTRVQASRWISKNIPAGAIIAVEHWDDRLPLFNQEKYYFLELPLYDQDTNPDKWTKISRYLNQANYLIIASHRLYVPLQKLENCHENRICYPKTAEYYQLLFNNQLDFELVADFEVRPGLKIGPWQISLDDHKADESFTVYDHPHVFIFQKK